MGWFGDLFRKKPGGSAFGNALRLIGDYATGGVYSAVNPVMPCSSRVDTGGQAGLVGVNQTGGFFGCGGSGFLFRGGFFGDIGDFVNDYVAPIIVPQVPTQTFEPNVGNGGTGIVPNASVNLFGMEVPSNIANMFNNIVNSLDNDINFDLNDIPSSVINTLDNFFGEEIPPQLGNVLGVNSNGDIVNPAQANTWANLGTNPWNIGGTIGGVDIQVGSSNNDVEEPKKSIFKRADEWLTNNVGYGLQVVSIAFCSVVALGAIGYYYYKKNRY